MSVAEAEITTEPDGASAPARSRAETRRRLVAAGTEIFAAEGLHGATSARIARRAGVASGTFYLHFPDKKALFREIVFAALDELRVRQARAVAGAPDAAAELRARTETLLRFAEEKRSLMRVLFGRDQDAGYVGEDLLARIATDLEARLRERQVSGDIPADFHPAVTAQAITGMTARIVAWWLEDPSRASREQLVDTILRMHPLHAGRSGE